MFFFVFPFSFSAAVAGCSESVFLGMKSPVTSSILSLDILR